MGLRNRSPSVVLGRNIRPRGRVSYTEQESAQIRSALKATVNNQPNPFKRTSHHALRRSAVLMLTLAAGSTLTHAQRLEPTNNNPVYLADSPIASDSLIRINELLAMNNLDEAVRLCDQVIREHGHRLMRQNNTGSDSVHIPVRARVHQELLRHPRLLEAYRRQITPKARVWLQSDTDWPQAAQWAWLTEPGLIASLRRAQLLIEAGQFQAGLALLKQLEAHPDADQHAQRALRLAQLARRFVTSEHATLIAQRWAQRTSEHANQPLPGVEPLQQQRAEDEQTNEQTRASSLIWRNQPSKPVRLDGVVPGVLARAQLTPITQLDLIADPTPSRMSGANWKPTAWAVPLVEGSSLFTNDGYTISCFDRFTLRPIWRVQTSEPDTEIPISADARARLGRIIEDATSISSDGNGAIYAAAGIPRSTDQAEQARLLKLEASSGRIIWSVDVASLDPSLRDAHIRGPIVVDQGTIAVVARTSNRRQRLISLSLVGIDSATGEPIWTRPIASAGSLPFQQMGQLAHNPIIDDGVGYFSDLIGLAAAVRIATGEVLWARPLPAPDLYARSTRPAFAGNSPIINTHGLFMLSSDGGTIIQLDPGTGQTITTRPADQLNSSLYLLSIDNDTFACISGNRVSYYDAERFATTSPTRSPELGEPDTGMTGRVIVAGDLLLAPVSQGVMALDPDRPEQTELIELDQTGNIVALDGQIIVVDQMYASSFLSWETASKLLEARIALDPGAAITLAELAFRSQRIDEIVPSVQRAISVVRAQPIDDRQALQSDLFGVVLDMVRPIEQHTSAPADDEIASSTGESALWERLGDQRLLELLRALGELARTHEQVVAHRMALGTMHERFGRPSDAIKSYQQVLDQSSLSRAMWEGSGIAVRAGLEASRRIGSIIERVGFGPYAPIESQAIGERTYIGNDASPDAYLQLAQRYPWATIAPSLHLEAARRYAQQSRLPASIDAARSGIDSARRLQEMGSDWDMESIESLSELLIGGLVSTSRSRDAHAAARMLVDSFPSITLRHQSRVITLEQLATAAGQSNTLPVLGDSFIADPSPLLLTGSPVRPVQRLDPGGVVLYAPQLGRLEYSRVGRNVFEPVWSRPAPGDQPPIIPWQGPTRTLIFWPEGGDGQDSGTIEAIETTTGTVVWSLHNVRLSLEQGSARVPDETARIDRMIPIPALGTMPIRQLIVACDGQSVIISDRVGRAMGVDLHSGQSLWQRDMPLNRLHDMDLRHGQLGICGLMVLDRAHAQRDGSVTPLVASIDPRTGEPGQIIERFGHQPRWVRVGDHARLFVASTQRITALNIEQGALDWVVNDDALSESEHAWVSDSHLLVLDNRYALWGIDPSDGSRPTQPIDTRGRISSRGWLRIISEIGRTSVLSSAGIVSFDTQQDIIATDPRMSGETITDIAWARDRAVELGEPALVDNTLECTLTLLDHTNARLLDTMTLRVPATLGRTPTSAVPINGGVIIGFGEVSVFVRTQN